MVHCQYCWRILDFVHLCSAPFLQSAANSYSDLPPSNKLPTYFTKSPSYISFFSKKSGIRNKYESLSLLPFHSNSDGCLCNINHVSFPPPFSTSLMSLCELGLSQGPGSGGPGALCVVFKLRLSFRYIERPETLAAETLHSDTLAPDSDSAYSDGADVRKANGVRLNSEPTSGCSNERPDKGWRGWGWISEGNTRTPK